ncbi:MAG: OpgC domain-containing protein [Bosea sp. (in: a-proteobacteria)]
MYVVLLAFAPLLILAVRKSPFLTLAGSFALYIFALNTGLNLPQVFGGEWFFNPFAWQLIFVIGLIAGHATLAGISLPRHPALIAVAIAIMTFVVSQKAPWHAFGLDVSFALALPFDLNYGTKSYVAPGRLISLLALAYLTATLLHRDASWLRSAGGRIMAQAGRQSLPVFAMGTVLSLLGFGALVATGNAPAVATAITLFGIGAMLSMANMLDQKPRQPGRALPIGPAVQS